ncbi:hypothetical protein [Alkalimonas amylolytica]|uniref:Haem-binding uptake Tiki superfamily ChaN domain-containing protein n=1 Tax=Alkalimonas amylolytica TaxID=152573 RepID=A0A1H3Y071_ALKAM|nr:hypothetical protein [Alkalimonas amylolytica]SEA04973.1 hypothetical protein SAMN04488051_101484 [Alkalimonas amylolytica]
MPITKYAKLRWVNYFLLAGLLSFSVSAEHIQENLASPFDNFVSVIEKKEADNFALETYLRLKELYREIEKDNVAIHKLWFSAQQLAVFDTFFGEYSQAEERQYKVHPGFGRQKSCPIKELYSHEALSVLPKLIADRQVVLINESHTRIASRAFILRILPVLKELGFSVLAMEGLNPHLDLASIQVLQARGYPLSTGQEGYYLREPVMGELVREAITLGFKLLPFDLAGAENREQREEYQAEVLAEFIGINPETKVAIISGYSHIHKTDGWMAERLQQKISQPILSIDQTSRITGCKHFEASSEPYVLLDEKNHPWSALPDNVDFTIIHAPGMDETTNKPAWLRLHGLREPIDVGNELCNETWPCLISAYYSDEQADAVPAGLVLLEDASSTAWLYLRTGEYLIKGINISGDTRHKNLQPN